MDTESTKIVSLFFGLKDKAKERCLSCKRNVGKIVYDQEEDDDVDWLPQYKCFSSSISNYISELWPEVVRESSGYTTACVHYHNIDAFEESRPDYVIEEQEI